MLWSDENKFELFGINSTHNAWRKSNADPKNSIHTVKNRANGQAMYCKILNENLLPSAKWVVNGSSGMASTMNKTYGKATIEWKKHLRVMLMCFIVLVV